MEVKKYVMLKKYFNNIPKIGNLYLEYIFYECGEPILFICYGNNKRYLCSCCKLSEKWIVSEITKEEILYLIDNVITIRSLFESNHFTFVIYWNGKSLDINFNDSISDILPDAKILEISKDKTNDYRKFIINKLKEE